jgi:Leucine-rich repeat (LRR) protein
MATEENDNDNESKSSDGDQVEEQERVQPTLQETGPRARLQELPLGWTQMAEPNPADRLRYPQDVSEINTTDTDIMIVGTAGQKITQMGPDFSSHVNPELTELVLRSHLIKTMEGLEGFTKLELLELYDNQVEELKCLGKGENGAPGPTLRVLDMSYNNIRDMKPVALCPNLQELCKLMA